MFCFLFNLSFTLCKMGYLSLGSPRSRTWAKDSNVNSLFESWSQETPVGEWGREERMGKKSAIKSVSSKYHCGQQEHNPAGGLGDPWRRCAQSSHTEGWGTGALIHHQCRSLVKGSVTAQVLMTYRQASRQASVTGQNPQAKKSDAWRFNIAQPPTHREGQEAMGGILT